MTDMTRRHLAAGLALGAVWFALVVPLRAAAQRVSQPIYRPVRPGRADRVVRPGRLDAGGVNYGAAPGAYTVVSVRDRDNVVRLRDENGNAEDVYVSQRLFDLNTLKPGDVVAVDFFAGGDNDERLEAATIEKLERVGE
jgi:hypothetical protein